ncbi:DUF2484 family protein [Primorskyibacter marinus]|uniref:DUF2484 family protein n=1 Tax=Primorskyibacter marinus TaxID=1977320 RepID=UPI000E3054C4|nr:DUF2484 family protein [Primorskyibacter marinus]
MTTSLLLACIWAIAATVTAMVWSEDEYPNSAYLLIVTGVPLLGFATWQNGPWVGLLVLAAGMSVLRWRVVFADILLRRLFGSVVD